MKKRTLIFACFGDLEVTGIERREVEFVFRNLIESLLAREKFPQANRRVRFAHPFSNTTKSGVRSLSVVETEILFLEVVTGS